MSDLPQFSIENEVFAIRDNERMTLVEDRPSAGRWLAVMARSVEMPPGERSPVRHSDGAPVEQAAILACEWGHKHQRWHWLQVSPPTKERIGDLMFDGAPCQKDRWYFLVVADAS